MSHLADPPEARLERLRPHLAGGFDVQRKVRRVLDGEGNIPACLEGLSEHALASALLAWFDEGDLPRARDWFRQAAVLDRQRHLARPDAFSPAAKTLQLLKPLLSDDDELIDWFAHRDSAYDAARVQDPRTVDFWAWQAVLALRGQWPLLEARSDRALALPPGPGLQRYQIDQRFYRGLARGDVHVMRQALADLLQPRHLATRSDEEGGCTLGLICTPAVIYTKMAWRRGWQIVPDSPLVPSAWLPVQMPPPFVSAYGLA